MKALSLPAKAYIFATILVGLSLAIQKLGFVQAHHWPILLVLSVLASLSLIFKVEGATDRSHYNFSFVVYAFTFLTLGVPAGVLVILISNVVEWLYHRYPWYIQSFNITSYVIVLSIAGVFYNLANPGHGLTGLSGLAGAILAIAVFMLLNHFMVGIVVWLARGENFIRSGVFEFFPLLLDFTLLAMGAGAAFIWALNPFATVFSLFPLYLIYNTLRVPALERKSSTDPKTGLYNSEYFWTEFRKELARAQRFDHPLVVVMGDLDLLRNINNTYGHLAGDVVLTGIADILNKAVGDYDVVSRFGGEEFAILMPETTEDEANPLVEQIRAQVEQTPFLVKTSPTPIRATISFGIAGRHGGDDESADTILHNADIALYHAKLTGRNRVIVYQEEGLSPFISANVQHPAGN